VRTLQLGCSLSSDMALPSVGGAFTLLLTDPSASSPRNYVGLKAMIGVPPV
jgi:hypothetical protein